ncbi:MAG: hypothetical protein MJ065_00225 [Oscillospiraceae bacterium]|nr:hypothetical protein [Oscillospiraceae bacterium]
MKNFRKYAVLFLLPLHILLILLFVYGSPADYVYSIATLGALLADFALSFLQNEIFTSRRSSIRIVMHDFRPYLLEKLEIIAADWIIILLMTQGDILRDAYKYCVSGILLTAMVILSAIVTFVTAAARTMMYHDEKR